MDLRERGGTDVSPRMGHESTTGFLYHEKHFTLIEFPVVIAKDVIIRHCGSPTLKLKTSDTYKYDAGPILTTIKSGNRTAVTLKGAMRWMTSNAFRRNTGPFAHTATTRSSATSFDRASAGWASMNFWRRRRYSAPLTSGRWGPRRVSPVTSPHGPARLRDLPNAEIHFVPSGHFALESHHREIAALIRDFLKRVLK